MKALHLETGAWHAQCHPLPALPCPSCHVPGVPPLRGGVFLRLFLSRILLRSSLWAPQSRLSTWEGLSLTVKLGELGGTRAIR